MAMVMFLGLVLVLVLVGESVLYFFSGSGRGGMEDRERNASSARAFLWFSGSLIFRDSGTLLLSLLSYLLSLSVRDGLTF
ncbi:hypothetical protein F4809DRAFT_602788 [Biscogniauxia mediterranea]|nr:hypothetical protein F4809DRAFT_602788 [Biscogniauxia mediterranea]